MPSPLDELARTLNDLDGRRIVVHREVRTTDESDNQGVKHRDQQDFDQAVADSLERLARKGTSV